MLKIKLKSCSAGVTDIACCCDTLFSPVYKRMAEVLLMVVFKSNLQSVFLHMKLTDAQSYSEVLTLLSMIDGKCFTYSRNSLRLFLEEVCTV